MFQIVLRKIFSNAWKVLCLLLGSILVVGMICSIPIYSNGILQRLLTKDLESALKTNSRYPGYINLFNTLSYSGSESGAALAKTMRTEIAGLVSQMPVEAILSEEILQINNLYHQFDDDGKNTRSSFDLCSISNLADHVNIIKGRMYRTDTADGILEVIASPAALMNSYMVLDRVYEIYSYKQKQEEPSLLKIKVVGVFEAADNQDLYWYQSINSFGEALMVDTDLLTDLSSQNKALSIDKQKLYAVFDFYQFRIQDIVAIEKACKAGSALAEANSRTTVFSTTFLSVIDGYNEREAELKLTLQILIIPILLMLIFYIFMVSQLMIRSETTVISVLESRGAGRSRILLIYGLESFILGAVTLVVGPILGFWMVRVIGASNGFLEFVGRKALQIQLDSQALYYGLGAVLIFLVTMLLPVFIQARTSIVQQKRKKSRTARPPLWQRIFLDIILLGISLYAYYRLEAQVELQMQTGASGTELNLDFLLFLSSTIFILGAGLLFLRLYPWILRLVYLLGRRWWSPVPYASFHQISRSGGQEQFLMIFLILALSIGLFNANAARTINSNTEDSLNCEVGANIRLQEYWQPYGKDGNPIVEMNPFDPISASVVSSENKVIKYIEPNIERFNKLEGVEHATRVYRTDKVRMKKTGQVNKVISLMAIDPYDFALAAWWRSDLGRHHLNEYMNVLSSMPNGVILSTNLRDEMELKVGDAIIYTVGNTDNVDGIIIAFVDYWPGFQPQSIDRNGNLKPNYLIVASLDFVLTQTTIQPYEVWLKRSAGANDATIYQAIEDARISITSIQSANQMITAAKNDPQLQGTNGALTLGFIVSMLVCAIGFLIYWIMAVQSRVLQFGVFRAMGLGKGSVIGMLLCEQGLVSGIAILFGIFLGNLCSLLYVPLFQLVYRSIDQPLPFRVIAVAADSQKIYVILGILLLLCCAVLIRLILRIRIDQAVKLGEE
ncbi:MAG TPA: hypothetical protein DD640_02425 [Clostridiales bacterium]|nr:hypothetical protein [Clostridiales bacterium]